MELFRLEEAFRNNVFSNEDDIKLHFYSDIVYPLLKELNPTMAGQYKSEHNLLAGGRTDATFQNIIFELKKYNYFKTEKGVNEALYGRNNKDHGLYDYIISNAGISSNDTKEDILKKISNGIGVGFDGVSFIFARFAAAHIVKKINTEKLNIPIDIELPIVFDY